MQPADLLWALPYLILAAVLGSIYWWRTARGRSLLAKGSALTDAGRVREAVVTLKAALRKANQKPDLEQAILDELARAYKAGGVAFDPGDYLLLVGQFRAFDFSQLFGGEIVGFATTDGHMSPFLSLKRSGG